MLTNDLSYSRSRDAQTGTGAMHLTCPRLHSQQAARVDHKPSSPDSASTPLTSVCTCDPFRSGVPPLCALMTGNRISVMGLLQLQNQTQDPVGNYQILLYTDPTLTFQADGFLPARGLDPHFGLFPGGYGIPVNTPRVLWALMKRWGSWLATAAAPACFPGPRGFASSLLNRLILCLMFHCSTRNPTVFITLPANYSQLLYCLQISFVTLLIIPQHNIGASTF